MPPNRPMATETKKARKPRKKTGARKLKKSAGAEAVLPTEPVRMGRPHALEETPKLIDQIRSLGMLQCTQKDAAGVLGVAVNTFTDFLSRNPASKAAWENGPSAGRVSVRRKQYDLAMKGNARLLVWLGKQWLDQRDKIGVSGPNGGPIQQVNASMTPAEAADAWAQALNGGP